MKQKPRQLNIWMSVESSLTYLRPAMPMRAQYSRSRALAFTTCSSLRPEYPELPSSFMSPSLGTWVLRERGRMATSSSSSCLRICHSTELLSLFRWQYREKVRKEHKSTGVLLSKCWHSRATTSECLAFWSNKIPQQLLKLINLFNFLFIN